MILKGQVLFLLLYFYLLFNMSGNPIEGKDLGAIFPELSQFPEIFSSFIEKEKFLLENDINERSLSHKLAEYIQTVYFAYDVDCEYNRRCQDIIKKLQLPPRIKPSSTDIKARTVFPDIIIHNRGDDTDNLLVIEIKKSENGDHESKDFDVKKINAYIKELKYQFGFYLEFDKSGLFEFKAFHKGKEYNITF